MAPSRRRILGERCAVEIQASRELSVDSDRNEVLVGRFFQLIQVRYRR